MRSATRSGRAARTSAASTYCAPFGATKRTTPCSPASTAALATATGGGPAFVGGGGADGGRGRDALDARIGKLGDLDPDTAEAGAGRLTALLATTTSAALLLEQSVSNPRKALVAVRYTRRHLNGGGWDDHIAEAAGRDILAHADISEAEAARAAA